jgi:hypothetical protein
MIDFHDPYDVRTYESKCGDYLIEVHKAPDGAWDHVYHIRKWSNDEGEYVYMNHPLCYTFDSARQWLTAHIEGVAL